jgi:hypothetical protein
MHRARELFHNKKLRLQDGLRPSDAARLLKTTTSRILKAIERKKIEVTRPKGQLRCYLFSLRAFHYRRHGIDGNPWLRETCFLPALTRRIAKILFRMSKESKNGVVTITFQQLGELVNRDRQAVRKAVLNLRYVGLLDIYQVGRAATHFLLRDPGKDFTEGQLAVVRAFRKRAKRREHAREILEKANGCIHDYKTVFSARKKWLKDDARNGVIRRFIKMDVEWKTNVRLERDEASWRGFKKFYREEKMRLSKLICMARSVRNTAKILGGHPPPKSPTTELKVAAQAWADAEIPDTPLTFDLLSEEEAARIVKMSLRNFRIAVKHGDVLPWFKTGQFLIEEITRWMTASGHDEAYWEKHDTEKPSAD